METPIEIRSGQFRLEGLFEKKNNQEKGVVITHPHPLYGGDMDNIVVNMIRQAYQECGFATLRFNFRGTGNSEGQFDNGLGERQDVLAAMDVLMHQGITQIHLAGYSFGAWVNTKIDPSKIEPLQRMIMVSPPVAFIDFSPIEPIPMLQWIITGSQDEIAPRQMIETLIPRWNPKTGFTVIQGADHFYLMQLKTLKYELIKAINSEN